MPADPMFYILLEEYQAFVDENTENIKALEGKINFFFNRQGSTPLGNHRWQCSKCGDGILFVPVGDFKDKVAVAKIMVAIAEFYSVAILHGRKCFE